MVKITTYAANVAKSAKYAFVSATKDSYSNIAEFADTNSELFREAYGDLRQYKTTAKRIAEKFKQSPVYEISSMAIHNTLEDLKTGDFYNKARQAQYDEKYMGDMFNIGDFDFESLGFDPEKVDELNFGDGDMLVSRTIAKTNKISANAIASAVVQSNANNAEVIKESTSMLYMQNLEISRQNQKAINTIGENMVVGFKDLASIQRTMVDNSAKFYNDTTTILQNMNKNLELMAAMTQPQPEQYQKKKATVNRIEDVGDIPDIKAYIQAIKKNVDDALGIFSPSSLKQMDQMMGEGSSMIRMMLANPLQSVMESAVKKVIPETLTESMDKLNDTIGAVFPAFVGRMNTLAKKPGWAGGNDITSFIGKLLRLDTEADKKVDLRVAKGPVPWDNTSKKYLEEVIPYYLRKMTAALTGEKEMVFDGETGKWKTLASARNDIAEYIGGRPKSAFYDFTTEMRRSMRNVVFNNYSDKEKFEKDYEKFMKEIFKAGDLDLKGKKGGDLGISDMSLDLIRKAMETMDPSVVMQLVSRIQANKRSISNTYRNIQGGSVAYKLLSEGVPLEYQAGNKEKNVAVDRHLNSPNYKGLDITKLTDKYDQTIFDYLHLINKNIEFFKTNGMITWPQGNFGTGTAPAPVPVGPNGSPVTPIGNIPAGYMANATSSNGVFTLRNAASTAAAASLRADEERRHNENVAYARRRGNTNTSFVNGNMSAAQLDDIARQMSESYMEDVQREREFFSNRRDPSEKTFIQSIFKMKSDREYMDKFQDLTNWKDKWNMSQTIGEKVFLVKDKLKGWIDAPSAMMEKAVLAADKHIFDLFYRTSTQVTDDEGRPIAGFMDLLRYKTGQMFNDVHDKLGDMFGDLKTKFKDSKVGKWLEDVKNKILGDEDSPLGQFRAAFKGQIGKIKDSYREAFENAAYSLGLPQMRQEIRDRRQRRADENRATEMNIEDIVSGMLYNRTVDQNVINKLLGDNDFAHETKASTLGAEERSIFDTAFGRAKSAKSSEAEYLRLKAIANDTNYSDEVRAAALKKIQMIDERIQEVNGFDFAGNKAAKQNEIKTRAIANKSRAKELEVQRNIMKGLDANGAVIQYASESEKDAAISAAFTRSQEIEAEIQTANAEIEAFRREIRRLKDREEEIINDKYFGTTQKTEDIVNQMAANPFEQLMKHVDEQRDAYKQELIKVEQDYETFEKLYERLNRKATQLNERITSRTASSRYTPEQLQNMEAERDRLTTEALSYKSKMTDSRNRRAELNSNISNTDDARTKAFKDAVERLKLENLVISGIEENRKNAANKARRRLNNGSYKSQELIDKINEDIRLNELDMLSDEYINSLDPKAKKYMTSHRQTASMIEAFLNDPNIDDAVKAELKTLYDNRGNFANTDEYERMKEDARLQRAEIFGLRSLARGGVNNGKGFYSIVSPRELHVSANGSVSRVGGSSPSIRYIAHGDKIINPGTSSQIASDAAAERKFKRSLASNAEANDRLNPTRIADAFKRNGGMEGLANGAIGAGAGLLLGSPLLGAAAGIATSVIKNNQKVNEALFGSIIDYDENGNPKTRDVNGIIKPYIQKAFPDMKSGGLLGSVLGLLTPLGPIGGALVGSGLGFFKNTQYAQDVLFGEGQLLSPENRDKVKKALPKMGIGAAAGALALGGPFGLVGGALLGAGGGLFSTTEAFKNAMFGEPDADGKRDGGIVGALKHELVDPLKDFGLDLLDHIKDTLKVDFFDPIKEAITPITNGLKDAFLFIPRTIGDTFKDKLITPISALVRDYIGEPIKNASKFLVTKATDLMLLPFRAVGKGAKFIGDKFKDSAIKRGRANYLTAAERNAERQKHKSRFLIGDNYREFDETLEAVSANSSIDDLSSLQNALTYNLEGEKGLNNALRKNTRDIDKAISDKFRVRFGNSGRAIMKAISADNYEKAFDLIRTTRTITGEKLTKDEADQLISEVQGLLKQRDEFKAKKETFKMTDDQLAQTAKAMGIKNWDKVNKNRNTKRKLIESLQAEINAKQAENIKYGSPEEAAKVKQALSATAVNENSEALTRGTEAIVKMTSVLESLNALLQYDSNNSDNMENIASARKADIAARARRGEITERQAADATGAVENIVNRHTGNKLQRENLRRNAMATYHENRQAEMDNYNAKVLGAVYALDPYDDSNVNESNTPNMMDPKYKDRALMLATLGKNGWYFDDQALSIFDSLTDDEAELVYNIFRFKFKSRENFTITENILNTVLQLSKREASKLGDFLDGDNTSVLTKYAGYPAELKDFIKTLSNRAKYKSVKRTHSLSESNNGIKRTIGRAGEAVMGQEATDTAARVVSAAVRSPMTAIKGVTTGVRAAVNAIPLVNTEDKYNKRRDELIQKIGESGMFDGESYVSPKTLRALTNDQLQSLLDDYENTKDQTEDNLPTNAMADDLLTPANAEDLLKIALSRSDKAKAEAQMNSPEFRLARMLRENEEAGGIVAARRAAVEKKASDKTSLLERITGLARAKKRATEDKMIDKLQALLAIFLPWARTNAEANDGLEPISADTLLSMALGRGDDERAEAQQNSPFFRLARMLRENEEAGGVQAARKAAEEKKAAYREGLKNGVEKAKAEAESKKAADKAARKGSKEETEEKAEAKTMKESIIGIKDSLGGILDKFRAKKDDLLEKKDSLLSRIMSAVGKAWFGIKLIGGVPLAVGFASKYVVPFIKDKFLPWFIGKKDASGNYVGGIASGIANSVGDVMVNKVIPTVKTGLSKAGGFLSEMWSTGKDVLMNDIMPAAVDLLVDNLPQIIESAIEGAWLVIKEGAKAVATKLGFGGSGDKDKADTKITSDVRRATGTTNNEINESQISRDVYKEQTKGKNAVAVVAQTAVSGPTADTEYHKRVVSANADLYNQYHNSGTEYLNQNYSDVIANNQQFQSVRDKEVQDLGVSSYGKKSILQVAGRNFTQAAAGVNAGTKVAQGTSKVLQGLGHTPIVGKVFKVADKGVQGIAAAGNAGNKIYMAANPQIAAEAAAKAAKQKAKGSLFGRLASNGEKEATKLMAEASSKTAVKAATEVAEEVVEKGALATVEESAKLAASSGEKTGLIAKITGGLKNLLTKFFEDSRIVKKLGPLAEKVGTPIKTLITKCKGAVGKLSEGLAAKLGFASTEALSKAASKACAIITLAQMVIDFLTGMDDARNILGVVDDDMGAFDRFLAGICKMLSGLLCYLLSPETILDIFIKIYDFLGIYYGNELKKRQEEAKEAIDLYNAEHGTDFENVKDFNDAIHPTVVAKAKKWIGNKVDSAKKGVEKFFSGAKDKLSDAGSAIKGFFTGDKKTKKKSSAEEIAENARADQGLDKIDNTEFSSLLNKALGENLPIGALADVTSKLPMNAEADEQLSPLSKLVNKIKDSKIGTTVKNALDNNPVMKFTKFITDPIEDIISTLYNGTDSVENQMSRFQDMNRAVNDQIMSGKLKVNDKKFWEINLGETNSFASSLFKLSEFMRRAITSPLSIIQDAINSVFDTEVTSATNSGTGNMTNTSNSSSVVLAGTTNNNSTESGALKPSTTTSNSSSSKKKGVLGKLGDKIKNFFSGKAAYKDTSMHNLKHKYLTPPKPLSDEDVSFIKSQYSGGGVTDHLYQRDFNDRFNIKGDSNYQSIADSGCGPVVASTVLQQKGMKYDVRDAAKAALKFKEKDGGTFPDYFGDYLGRKGVQTSNITNRSELRRRLQSGESVILMGQSGKGNTPFGSQNPHYVLATGMKNNEIIIQDPEDTKANALYNANDVIRDSMYAIGTGKGRKNKLTGLGGVRYARSGMGALNATQEANWYKVLHELIILGEVGSNADYSCVVGDDEGAMSMGVIGFHAGNAQRVLNAIADRVPDADDANYLRQIAAKAGGTISSSEASKTSEILKKYPDISKDVQDQDAYNLYKTTDSYQDALSDYTINYVKDPRSTLVAADMYNIGWHNGWKDGWTPSKTGNDEIDQVADRISTAGWFANSGYASAYAERAKKAASVLKGISLDNYTSGTILGNGFTAADPGQSLAGNSENSSTDNTFIGKLAAYIKKAMKKMYGGVYEALFGSIDSQLGNTSGTTSSTKSSDYMFEYPTGNGADAWFLQTLEGSSVSSGYRTSGRPDHAGIDYAAATGTKIYASTDGAVVFSDWNTGGYGYLVIIQDTHNYYHIYGHQDRMPVVKVGDEVTRGTHIGYVGNTGESFGAHLHYQVNKPSNMWHADVDPNKYDYSDYIKSATTRNTVSADFMGPLMPSQSRAASGVSDDMVKAAVKALSNDSNVQVTSGKKRSAMCGDTVTNASAMCNTKSGQGKVKRVAVTENDVKSALGAMVKSSGEAKAVPNRHMTGALDGSNRKQIGEDYSNTTNQILVAIANLLGNISCNTEKLEDVVALLTKLTVSNTVALQGTGNSKSGSCGDSKSGKANEDVMADIAKIMSATSLASSKGLSALNRSFQNMNSSQIIDAVYNIARQ